MSPIYQPKRWALDASAEPAQEPIPLQEMKAHSVIEAADDEALMSGFIIAARRAVENFTHRAMLTKTLVYKIDRFPDFSEQVIELPGGKLQAITSIQYVDTAGATQTWAASNYIADTEWETGRIALAFEKTWPTVREWHLPVTITYTAGFGVDPADVPEELRTAIKMLAAELYEHREESIVGAPVASVSLNAKMLAGPHRLIRMT